MAEPYHLIEDKACSALRDALATYLGAEATGWSLVGGDSSRDDAGAEIEEETLVYPLVGITAPSFELTEDMLGNYRLEVLVEIESEVGSTTKRAHHEFVGRVRDFFMGNQARLVGFVHAESVSDFTAMAWTPTGGDSGVVDDADAELRVHSLGGVLLCAPSDV